MNDRVFNALRKIATDIDNVPAAKALRAGAGVLNYRPGIAHALPGYATGPRPSSGGDKMKKLIAPLMAERATALPALGYLFGNKLRKMLPKYDINAPRMMEAVHTDKATTPGR